MTLMCHQAARPAVVRNQGMSYYAPLSVNRHAPGADVDIIDPRRVRVAQVLGIDAAQSGGLQISVDGEITAVPGGGKAGEGDAGQAVDVEAYIEGVLLVDAHEPIVARYMLHDGGRRRDGETSRGGEARSADLHGLLS